MTELDWPYKDEDRLKCLIELFPDDSVCYWQVGEITHENCGGIAYQIAYDLIRELHAQKAEIARLGIGWDQEEDHASYLREKAIKDVAEIERYRSALQEIRSTTTSNTIAENHMDYIAMKALEDKQ